MRPKIPFLVLLCGTLLADAAPAAAAWTFRSGESLPGDPVAFDFERKTLTFHDPLSDRETIVPTHRLSLRSRQRLLVSPLFHRGDRDDALWTPEKLRLLVPALGIPAAALFIAFWGAAFCITGRFNPLLAFVGFLGSWVVLLIFGVCYAFLEMRLDGGAKILLLGAVVALGVTPLYLSAVYNCTYLRAQSVLLSHLVAGICVLALGLAATGLVAGREKTEAWWDRVVFEPVGLIAADPERHPPAP